MELEIQTDMDMLLFHDLDIIPAVESAQDCVELKYEECSILQELESDDFNPNNFIPSSPNSDLNSDCVSPFTQQEHIGSVTEVKSQKTFKQMYPEITKELHRSLLEMSVKDFNTAIKKLSLSTDAANFLKLERKRNKNRDAAIRSRAKKDTYVHTLEKEVDLLRKENQKNLELIHLLKERIEKLESKSK